jgi:prophage regulatory protein
MSDKPDCIIRIAEVMRRTGLTRSTLYRKIDSGRFPKGLKLSERCVGWRESAVKAWLDNPFFYHVDDRKIPRG